MNERIQEFAKHHLVRDEHTEFGWRECHKYEFDPDELEKFAELIVRECANVIADDELAKDCDTLRRLHEENERLRDAVAAEREACAKVCEETLTHHYIKKMADKDHPMLLAACADCAAAIRARNN